MLIRLIKELRLSWKMLLVLAKKHIPMLIIQAIAYCLLICYSAVIEPILISSVYSALEMQNILSLYKACALGGGAIACFFVICYLNNVYLDLNSFCISLTANQNACKLLVALDHDRISRNYSESELLNRIDSCTNSIAAIIPLTVSVFANCASILVLLIHAGQVSYLLLIITAIMTYLSYIMTMISSHKRKLCEYEKQAILDDVGETLRQSVINITSLLMCNKQDYLWLVYQQKRKSFWGIRFKQELIGIINDATTELLSSILRIILGWNLYGFYEKKKISSSNISSIFSTFDKMQALAQSFAPPVSNLKNCCASIERFNEIICAEKQTTSRHIVNNQREHVISLSNVNYDIGQRKILQNINLSVNRGEKIAILGANGSGKSTLLRIIAGLNIPSQGDVFVLNVPPTEFSNEVAHRNISYIPSHNLLFSQSVKDNIYMNCDTYDEEALTNSCTLAGMSQDEISSILEKNALQVSEGQMHRINIARGIINKVPLWLADEPDSSVQSSVGSKIISNIVEQADTAIVVTHHAECLHMFTRVLILNCGMIIADDTPETIIDSYAYNEWIGHKEEEQAKNEIEKLNI